MRNRFACFLMLLYAFIFQDVRLDAARPGRVEPYFRISEAEGYVRVRRFFSTEWIKAYRGMHLYRNDTLLSGDASRVRIRSYKLPGQDQSQKEVTVTRPFVARVNDELLRSVTVNVFFQKSFEANDGADEKGQMSFGEAWRQLSAQRFTEFFQPRVDLETSLAVAAQEIKIRVPFLDQIFQAQKLPGTLRVVWEKPQKYEGEYSVYFWPSDVHRPLEPLDETEQNFYTLRILHHGSYNVQIQSPDKKFQSRIINFSFEGSDRTQTKNDGALDYLDLKLAYPPRGFVVRDGNLPVVFSWRVISANSQQLKLELHSLTHNTREVFATKDQTFERRLSPGLYRWRVTDHRERIASSWFELEIASASERIALKEAFRHYWSAEKPVTLEVQEDMIRQMKR